MSDVYNLTLANGTTKRSSYRMCICDSPDMYAQSLMATGSRTEDIHNRQMPHAHVTTITLTPNFMHYSYVVTIYIVTYRK